jgi:PhnB protein
VLHGGSCLAGWRHATAGVSTLTSHIVTREPNAAASWYIAVLGAKETNRLTLPSGQELTIELRFGDSVLAIADEFPGMGVISPLTLGGTYGALHLAVDDAGEVWRRALVAGATEFESLHDAFWGDRTGQFIDPFGHRWAIDQHLRDVPHEELVRLAGEAFTGVPDA